MGHSRVSAVVKSWPCKGIGSSFGNICPLSQFALMSRTSSSLFLWKQINILSAGIRYCLSNHPCISVLLHRMGSEAPKCVGWVCLTLLRFMVLLDPFFSLSHLLLNTEQSQTSGSYSSLSFITYLLFSHTSAAFSKSTLISCQVLSNCFSMISISSFRDFPSWWGDQNKTVSGTDGSAMRTETHLPSREPLLPAPAPGWCPSVTPSALPLSSCTLWRVHFASWNIFLTHCLPPFYPFKVYACAT